MALGGQCGRINQHAIALNAVQRLAAGDLQPINEPELVIRLYLRPQNPMHFQRLVGVLDGVFRRLGDIDLVEADLVGALATQVFKGDATAT